MQRFKSLLVILCINVVIRSAWLAYMHPQQTSDFLNYYEEAVAIFHGQGYRTDGAFTAYFPMGYPFFLALLFRVTGPTVLAGQIANAVLSTGIAALVYLVALRLTQRNPVALWTGFGYTLLPGQIGWNAMLGTEELFTFLLAASLAVYLYANRKSGLASNLIALAVSGALLGLACIVRPIVLLFPAFLLIYEWRFRRILFKAAILKVLVFSLVMLIAISPATIRNAETMHAFIPVSTNGGVNLWQGIHSNNAYYWSDDPSQNPLLQAGQNEVARDAIGKREFKRFVLSHPLAFLGNGILKIYYLYQDDSNVCNWLYALGHWGAKLCVGARRVCTYVYYLWMMIALFGLGVVMQQWARSRIALRGSALERSAFDEAWLTVGLFKRRGAGLLLLYIAYNTLIFMAFPAWDRFRYPMMPFYGVFFGVGGYFIWTAVRHKTGRRRPGATMGTEVFTQQER